jgi:glycosyltransferase involved in cell wall biosynthesis
MGTFVGEAFGAPVRKIVGDCVGEAVVGAAVGGAVSETVGDAVGGAIGKAVIEAIGEAVVEAVDDAVLGMVWESVSRDGCTSNNSSNAHPGKTRPQGTREATHTPSHCTINRDVSRGTSS